MGEAALNDLKKKLQSTPKVKVGGALMAVGVDELDTCDIEKAKLELRETPEVVQESFKILQDLLADEEDLFIPLEKEFLQRFLRRCKWYPSSAFKLIKRFYDYKRKHPDFFINLKPSNERPLLLSGLFTPLPRSTVDGAQILLMETGGKWNPKEISLSQIIRGLIFFVEVAMVDEKNQISGVRVVIDMNNLSLSHVTYFTPSLASAIIDFVGKSMPCRLKGVHIINQSFIFDMVFAFFKPFLHGKIRERIYFHGGDSSSILKYIDEKALPKKYGGEFEMPEEPIGEQLYDYAYIFEKYFEDLSRYGYVNEI